jgi:hypothetical protein
MSSPKKPLLATLSAAALVASISFAYAQSSDEGAYPNANVNGTIDSGADQRSYPADGLPANNPDPVAAYDSAPAAAGYTNTDAAPADSTMAAAPTAPATGFQPNVGIDGTPCIPEGSAGQRSGVYDPATSTCVTAPTATLTTEAAPAAPAPMEPAAAPAPTTASNMVVTDAPETRVDLSPPSEPLYNLPESGMRAPRPDRN